MVGFVTSEIFLAFFQIRLDRIAGLDQFGHCPIEIDLEVTLRHSSEGDRTRKDDYLIAAKHLHLAAIAKRNLERVVQVFGAAVLVLAVLDAEMQDHPV